MRLLTTIKHWAKQLKTHIYGLYLAASHSDTPLLVKLLITCIVAYALSPIDLIPDFIPIVGMLDDFILLPVGIWLAIRFIPNSIWLACKQQAQANPIRLGKNKWAGITVIIIWLSSLLLISYYGYKIYFFN